MSTERTWHVTPSQQRTCEDCGHTWIVKPGRNKYTLCRPCRIKARDERWPDDQLAYQGEFVRRGLIMVPTKPGRKRP